MVILSFQPPDTLWENQCDLWKIWDTIPQKSKTWQASFNSLKESQLESRLSIPSFELREQENTTNITPLL